MASKTRLARVAGLLYLIVAVCGGFSELYVRSSVMVPGDAAATAAKVSASATLFRVGFVTDLVSITCFLLLALTLYALLSHVSHQIALSMMVIVAVSVAIMSLNMLNHLGALLVATDSASSAGLGAASSDTLVLLLLDLHRHGYLIAEIFFGLWLLPLGYLVFTSGFFPRALGVLLIIGGLGYLADLVATLLTPNFEWSLSPYVLAPAVLAEVWFIGWLLVKGANQRRAAPVPAAA
jgi:Domain of unknown function (DUF4386)